MPEYLKMRCCMCPNIGEQNDICPALYHKKEKTPCRFVKTYIDNRGWIYFVRSGLGENNYKGFYAKNIEDYRACHRQHGMRSLEWRKTFDEAQGDLNVYAEKKGWKELNYDKNDNSYGQIRSWKNDCSCNIG